MNLRNITINTTLAVTGIAMWSYGSARLASGGEFEYRPNPLGLKESPYGQVIAIAMQGGVSSDWHGVESGGAVACTGCGHDHSPEDHKKTDSAGSSPSFLNQLEIATTERTNPRPANKAHKFYLRRQAEDKLKVAYELDPSNYANYNSYHLFLTEPQVGTRPVMTNEVIRLAEKTIQYCLREQSDPRPALTAASACCNILQLMFQDKDNHRTDEMRHVLATLDTCLARHHELSSKWIEDGTYENLSTERQQELLDRLSFCSKIRDTSETTIQRRSSGANVSMTN